MIINPYRFGVAPWTPANMGTSPQLWLDHTSPITNVSGTASLIENKGSLGANGNFNQTTAARRPAINATGLNGLRTLDFDGLYTTNGDKMECGTASALNVWRNVGQGWAFIVYQKQIVDSGGAGRNIFRAALGTAGNARIQMLAGRTAHDNTPALSIARLDGDAATIIDSPSGPRTDPVMMLAHVDYSGNLASLYIDGDLDASAAIGASGGNTSNTASSNPHTIASVAPGNDAGNGDPRMACFIAGGGFLPTSDEIDKLFGWAAHIYGLAGNLDVSHPYKSAPP